MEMDDYQIASRFSARYPEVGTGSVPALTYVLIALCGETGSAFNHFRKTLNGDDGPSEEFLAGGFPVLTTERKIAIAEGLGASLWYLSRVADELGIPLSSIAEDSLVHQTLSGAWRW